MRRAKQGIFKPRNPKKYRGDAANIVYRSSWELRAMAFFDENDDVIWWSSEEVVVPYLSPVDGRIHRYYPDFLIEAINTRGEREKFLIEVKPLSQTKPPDPSRKKTKRYKEEVVRYAINVEKWRAAERACLKNNVRFQILTEREILGAKDG